MIINRKAMTSRGYTRKKVITKIQITREKLVSEIFGADQKNAMVFDVIFLWFELGRWFGNAFIMAERWINWREFRRDGFRMERTVLVEGSEFARFEYQWWNCGIGIEWIGVKYGAGEVCSNSLWEFYVKWLKNLFRIFIFGAERGDW